jgi:hypothetical protein
MDSAIGITAMASGSQAFSREASLEDAISEDTISEDDLSDEQPTSTHHDERVQRALEEMRGASQSEKVDLVHGLLQGAGMDGLAELVNGLLRKRRAQMGHLLVAWVSSGRRRSRVKSLRTSLEDPKLKNFLPRSCLSVVVPSIRTEWKKLVQCPEYFGKQMKSEQPDLLAVKKVFWQLEDVAPTWTKLLKDLCEPPRADRASWSADTDVPEWVQRRLIFLTMVGLGLYQSRTSIGYRTQLGVYLKHNGLHQRAVDVLYQLGVTTGRERIRMEMKRMEQAAKASTVIKTLPFVRAYCSRKGLRHSP